MKLIELLEGKKTYILGTLSALVVLAKVLGYLTADEANQFLTILGVGAVFTLRSAIK